MIAQKHLQKYIRGTDSEGKKPVIRLNRGVGSEENQDEKKPGLK